MSLGEDENSVSVSNGGVCIDVLVVNVGVDTNVGTGYKAINATKNTKTDDEMISLIIYML